MDKTDTAMDSVQVGDVIENIGINAETVNSGPVQKESITVNTDMISKSSDGPDNVSIEKCADSHQASPTASIDCKEYPQETSSCGHLDKVSVDNNKQKEELQAANACSPLNDGSEASIAATKDKISSTCERDDLVSGEKMTVLDSQDDKNLKNESNDEVNKKTATNPKIFPEMMDVSSTDANDALPSSNGMPCLEIVVTHGDEGSSKDHVTFGCLKTTGSLNESTDSAPKLVLSDMTYRSGSTVAVRNPFGYSSSSEDSSSSDEEVVEEKNEEDDEHVDKLSADGKDGAGGPRRKGVPSTKTKGEMSLDDLAPIEELKITVPEDIKMVEVGQISSVVGLLVIVQAKKSLPALNMDSILFLEERKILGQVFETFGRVTEPLYSVRFNKAEDITERGIEPGKTVYFAPESPEYTFFVFLEQLRQLKGSDASWEHNNEPPAWCKEYSDDEEERKSRRKATAKSRKPEDEEENGAEQTDDNEGKRKRKFKSKSKKPGTDDQAEPNRKPDGYQSVQPFRQPPNPFSKVRSWPPEDPSFARAHFGPGGAGRPPQQYRGPPPRHGATPPRYGGPPPPRFRGGPRAAHRQRPWGGQGAFPRSTSDDGFWGHETSQMPPREGGSAPPGSYYRGPTGQGDTRSPAPPAHGPPQGSPSPWLQHQPPQGPPSHSQRASYSHGQGPPHSQGQGQPHSHGPPPSQGQGPYSQGQGPPPHPQGGLPNSQGQGAPYYQAQGPPPPGHGGPPNSQSQGSAPQVQGPPPSQGPGYQGPPHPAYGQAQGQSTPYSQGPPQGQVPTPTSGSTGFYRAPAPAASPYATRGPESWATPAPYPAHQAGPPPAAPSQEPTPPGTAPPHVTDTRYMQNTHYANQPPHSTAPPVSHYAPPPPPSPQAPGYPQHPPGHEPLGDGGGYSGGSQPSFGGAPRFEAGPSAQYWRQ